MIVRRLKTTLLSLDLCREETNFGKVPKKSQTRFLVLGIVSDVPDRSGDGSFEEFVRRTRVVT